LNPSLVPNGLQVGFSGVALACGGWWTFLSILALKRPSVGDSNPLLLDWAAVVPAHNEEALIATTVASLRAAGVAQDRLLVVADNCDDNTAEVASAAGATVISRDDPLRRGKSYALEFALAQLRTSAIAPSVVLFVDADTEISSNTLSALGERISAGCHIVQAHYEGARSESAVSGLRRLALALVHWSRPLGAARLSLPTTLKGNGMAFRWETIRDGFPGAGITEDAAATLAFAKSGEVVWFEPGATVTGRMAASYDDAKVQDLRWEGGRLALAPAAGWAAARLLLHGKVRAAAAAAELASPPLTLSLLIGAAGLSLAVVGVGSVILGAAGLASLGAYIVLGLAAARPPADDLRTLVQAPLFIWHKLKVYRRLTRGQPKSWQRTTR
jgi:hypothetical protein